MVVAASYFRLHGRLGSDKNYEEFVNTLPVTLGRNTTGRGHYEIDAGDPTISRIHVRIDWTGYQYELTCLSKNGAIVDKRKVTMDCTAPLKNNSSIRVGTSKFYITFPKRPPAAAAAAAAAAAVAGGAEGEQAEAGAATITSPGKAKAAAPRKRKAAKDDSASAGALSMQPPAKHAHVEPLDQDVVDGGGDGGDVDGWLVSSFAAGAGAAGAGAEKPTRCNYAQLVRRALDSQQLSRHPNGGWLQKDIVDWICKNSPEAMGKARASVNQSVSRTLAKFYVKLEDPGPVRWDEQGRGDGTSSASGSQTQSQGQGQAGGGGGGDDDDDDDDED